MSPCYLHQEMLVSVLSVWSQNSSVCEVTGYRMGDWGSVSSSPPPFLSVLAVGPPEAPVLWALEAPAGLVCVA